MKKAWSKPISIFFQIIPQKTRLFGGKYCFFPRPYGSQFVKTLTLWWFYLVGGEGGWPHTQKGGTPWKIELQLWHTQNRGDQEKGTKCLWAHYYYIALSVWIVYVSKTAIICSKGSSNPWHKAPSQPPGAGGNGWDGYGFSLRPTRLKPIAAKECCLWSVQWIPLMRTDIYFQFFVTRKRDSRI